jgi:hypothetical protein
MKSAPRKTGRPKSRSQLEARGVFAQPLLFGLLLSAPVVAAAILVVWSHLTTVKLGYALSAVSRRHESILAENKALRVEASLLRSPDRLGKLAGLLGLFPMGPAQVLAVESHPLVAQACPTQGATGGCAQ